MNFIRLLLISVLFLPRLIFAADGSESDPFTSLKEAHFVPNVGVYHFNIDGAVFETHVGASGYILVALDTGNGVGTLTSTDEMFYSKRGILQSSILQNFSEIDEIRVISEDALDATTRDADLLTRIRNFQTLHRGQSDNTINENWTGVGSGAITGMTTGCNTTHANSLASTIFHVCGWGGKIHWIPVFDMQRIVHSDGEIGDHDTIGLWVRSDKPDGSVDNPFQNVSQASTVVTAAGDYNFNIGGTTFTTHVDADGYILIAHEFGSNSANLPERTAVSTASTGILNTTILSTLTDIAELKMEGYHGGDLRMDITSTNATLISKVQSGTTLHRGINDNTANNSWTGTGSGYITANTTCHSSVSQFGQTLRENVAHMCGIVGGIHWQPRRRMARVSYSWGEIGNNDTMALRAKGSEFQEAADDIVIVKLEHSGAGSLYCPLTVTAKAYLGSAVDTSFTGNVLLSHSDATSALWSGSGISGANQTNGTAYLKFESTDNGQKTINFTALVGQTGDTNLKADHSGEEDSSSLTLGAIGINSSFESGSSAVYSGKTLTATLTAVSGTLDSSGKPVCNPMTNIDGNQVMEVASLWPDNSTPEKTVSLNNVALPLNGNTTDVTVDWDKGEADFDLGYLDTGSVNLEYKFKNIAMANTANLSNNVEFYPYKLRLKLETDEKYPATDGLVAAGETFQVQVEALTESNEVLNSFGQLGYFDDADDFTLEAKKTAGSSEVGTLTPTLLKQNGNVYFNLTYSEIGDTNIAVDLDSYMADSLTISGAELVVGEFYPDHYKVIDATVTDGTLASHCGSFNYRGQTVKSSLNGTFEISAHNKQGGVVKNLTTSFPAFTATTLTTALTGTDFDKNTINLGSITGPDSNHRYKLPLSVELSLPRSLTSNGSPPEVITPTVSAQISGATMPYGASLKFNGSDLSATNTVDVDFTSGEFRYGRGVLHSSSGSSTSDQTLRVDIEYFSNNSYILSDDDDCSALTFSAPKDLDTTDGFDFTSSSWVSQYNTAGGNSTSRTAVDGVIEISMPGLDSNDQQGTVGLGVVEDLNNDIAVFGLSDDDGMTATYGVFDAASSVDQSFIYLSDSF